MDNSLKGDPHKQKGWEHICTVLVLVAEYLSVKYSIVWLAWSAAVFLWFAVHNYARHYLGPRFTKIATLAAIPIIVVGTYYLTKEPKKPQPSVQAEAMPASQSSSQPQVQPATPQIAPKKTKPQAKTAIPPAQDNSVHIDNGSKIEQQSSGNCSPNIVGGSNNVNCGPPPLEMKWSAKRVDPPQLTEDKRAFKYQQQVTIKVNQPYTPVSVGVVCSADIGEIQGFLVGGSAQFFPKHGTDRDNKKLGFVYFEGSPATPANPLVISIWSDQPLAVLQVDKANINTN